MRVFKKINNIISSDAARDTSNELIKNAIGALMKDPVAFLELVKQSKLVPSMLRDAIFMECFQVFLLNSYDFDEYKQEFVDDNMTSFAVALAEVSPNEESGYKGDLDKLNEYAKRIIKIIDDCGTIQKSFYIACLARAVRSKKIDANKFFKLSHCIRNLTEEDLLLLNKSVSTDVVDSEEDYIDDFRALGLMRDVAGGFIYTKRAFELKKYALDYECKVDIPDKFQERYKPITFEPIGDDGI
ncbi:hypothetical protein SAMN05216390_13418 [Lachnospiraceae bacterium KH1T2]|nr:hypothetical protein SAMN05216390_13418 [Lachnospiraceae bacterium KH1T2]